VWPFSPEESFWSWFQKHQDEFFEFEAEHERTREWLFDRLSAQLSK